MFRQQKTGRFASDNRGMKRIPWQQALLLAVTSNVLTVLISLQTRVARRLTTASPPFSLELSHPQTESKRSRLSPKYRLAFEQSLGFFDDVDPHAWKVHRLQALTTPHYIDLAHPDSGILVNNSSATWLYNNWIPNFSCPRLSKVGGLGDGPKWTCDVDRLATIVDRRRKEESDEQRRKKEQGTVSTDDDHTGNDDRRIEHEQNYCLVYSIGSNGDYTFEDALVSAIGPICEIHIFDPGSFERSGLAAHNMFYHQWGLTSSYQQSNFVPGFLDGLEMYSFREIRRKLGHENRTIDILKIDCEGCEWITYKDWLRADIDVRQILIETHHLPTPGQSYSYKGVAMPRMSPNQFFDEFERNGFGTFTL